VTAMRNARPRLARLLLGLALLIAAVRPAHAAEADQRALVREAFLFAFPIYEFARTRQPMVGLADRPGRLPANRLGHRRELADPSNRGVTTPNNDTLYSAGFLDLGPGPVELTLPALPDRYHSIALLDIYSDNFAILGTRDGGGRGGRYLLAGPGWKGAVPAGSKLVRATSNDVAAVVRVLVDGPDDLAAARGAQDGFRLSADRPARPLAVAAPNAPDPAAFLGAVNELLGRGPVPPEHAARLKRFARVGLVPGRVAAWDGLTPALRQAWSDALAKVPAELRDGLAAAGTRRNGWTYPRAGIGRFGTDDFYRSQIALTGFWALPPEEAMYLTAAAAADGSALDGRRVYRLRIPAGVPVDAFWSLSMYEVDPDGRLFFTPNRLARYAIGDRTPGLARNADGSVDVLMAAEPPAGSTANWLPAPAGPFRVTFRAYLPRPDLAEGRFVLPPIGPAAAR